MKEHLHIHPSHPQARLISNAVERIRAGAVVIYPTDSSYALGCHIGDKAAQDRIRAIRQLTDKHNFTLVCRDLSELSSYAKVENSSFRLLKAHTPGAFTFILNATRDVPKRLQNPKRKTIGLRVPDNPIVDALLSELGEPLMSVTLQLPDSPWPIAEVDDLPLSLTKAVDLIIDGGHCGLDPTTVVDLTDGIGTLLRQGKAVFQE